VLTVKPIKRYRAKATDSFFPMTLNRPYTVTGAGRGKVTWRRHPRRAHLQNEPDPRLLGELLLIGVTSGC
jgi:hypothetical protein